MATYECYEALNQEPEDAVEVNALYEEWAAEKYAEQFDYHSGEGPTPEQDIMVRKQGTDVFTRYVVYMEPHPHYSAVKVKK